MRGGGRMHHRWVLALSVVLSSAACDALESRTSFATIPKAPSISTLTSTAWTPIESPDATRIGETSSAQPVTETTTPSPNSPATLTPPTPTASSSETASLIESRTPTPTRFSTATGTRTPTPTLFFSPTGTRTPTPAPAVSPTVRPNPPYLRVPDEGAWLDPSGSWLFIWWADPAPCYTSITIDGPGGRRLGDDHVESTTIDYRYVYDTPEDLPADAVGRWAWYIDVICPTGSIRGGTRTFYFYIETPTPFFTRTPAPTPTPFFTPTGTRSPTPPPTPGP